MSLRALVARHRCRPRRSHVGTVSRGRIAPLVALVLGSLTAPAVAGAQQAPRVADYAREKKWADEITPGIVAGDAVHLEIPGHQTFLAIYTEAPSGRAALVIAHGLGVHPDWGLIGVLRSNLPDLGYSTLSIQMPVLASDAKGDDYPPTFPEAGERLAAAVGFLRARGHRTIGIVSHSMGSRMANAYLARYGAGAVRAWVAIGLSGNLEGAPDLTLPLLDLFGEDDLPAVLQGAPERAAAMRGMEGYKQARAPQADHFFSGRHADLVRHVREFLDGALGR